MGAKTGAQDAVMKDIINKMATDANSLTREDIQWLQDFKPELIPELEKLTGTNLANIKVDAAMRGRQMKYLDDLDLLSKEGMSETDKTQIMKNRIRRAKDRQGADNSILENMQSRGMLGGGAEFAARSAAADNAINNQSLEDQEVLARAEQGRRNAMQEQARIAAGLEQLDYNRAADIANAQDEINRFNVENSNNRTIANTGITNDAGMYNNRGRQGVHETNVNGRNSFQFDKLDRVNNARQMQYNQAVQEKNAILQKYLEKQKKKAAMGQAIGSVVGGVAGSFAGPGGTMIGAGLGSAIGGAASGASGYADYGSSANMAMSGLEKRQDKIQADEDKKEERAYWERIYKTYGR